MDQKDIKRDFIKYFEINEIEEKAYQNLWDSAKAMLKGKFWLQIPILYNEKKWVNFA